MEDGGSRVPESMWPGENGRLKGGNNPAQGNALGLSRETTVALKGRNRDRLAKRIVCNPCRVGARGHGVPRVARLRPGNRWAVTVQRLRRYQIARRVSF